ncbi:hypothetical protein BC332_12327 [Capsicum chinense]|nr:hypothetical protein BC332_12327 [Capsicum chinense]
MLLCLHNYNRNIYARQKEAEKLSLLEWFANEYRRFGCSLEFVTTKSQEGSQFCRVQKLSGKACTGVQGLSPDLSTHVLSEKFHRALKMDELHGEPKLASNFIMRLSNSVQFQSDSGG